MTGLWLGRILRQRVRTLLLLCGFAVGVASAFVLMAVGHAAVAVSWRGLARDLGDGILVPEGFQGVNLVGENPIGLHFQGADYLVSILHRHPWLSCCVKCVAPRLEKEMVYVRRRKTVVTALATGVDPVAQAALEKDPSWHALDERRPQEFSLAEYDGFHSPPRKSGWMEWHYFNFMNPGKVAGYVSLIVYRNGSEKLRGETRVLLIEKDRSPRLFTERTGDIRLIPGRAEIGLGKNGDAFSGGKYSVRIRFKNGGVRANLTYSSLLPGFPYFDTRFSGADFGYVQPILRGIVTGSITAGGRTFRLNGAEGYHDHNWGKMGDITWDWGEASQAGPGGYAISYGFLRPATGAEKNRLETPGTLFLGRGDRVLAILHPEKIAVRFAGGAPQSVSFTWTKKGSRLAVSIRLHQPRIFRAGKRAFVQALGDYTVTGNLLGHAIRFNVEGFTETFARIRYSLTKK